MINLYLGISISLLSLLGGQLFASELSDAVSQMQAGSWSELSTAGFDDSILLQDGGHHIFEFSESMKWDPQLREVHFIGGGHANPTTRHIVYSENNNTWIMRPLPLCCGSHGYDHAALDPVGRTLYFRQFNNNQLEIYNLDDRTWSTSRPINISDFQVAGGLAWIPDMQAVLFADFWGALLYDPASDRWSTLLNRPQQIGDYHNFAEYSAVHRVTLFGGGNNGTRTIYLVDQQGNVRRQADAPIPLGTNSGSVVTVDPVSGNFVVFNESGSTYDYDPVADRWTSADVGMPILVGANNGLAGAAATPVSTYGVIMAAKYDFGTSRVYVYKHTAGSGGPPPPPPPPADDQPPTVTLSASPMTLEAGEDVSLTWVSTNATGCTASDGWSGSKAVSGTQTIGPITDTATFSLFCSGPGGSASDLVRVDVLSSVDNTGFAQKCNSPGVLHCAGFDSENELFYTWPSPSVCDQEFSGRQRYGIGSDRSGPGNAAATVWLDRCIYPEIDETHRHSGAGSLKFTVESNTGENSSGWFAEPFQRKADGTFGYIAPGSPLGNVVYMQWRQYFDQNFLNTSFRCTLGSCGGWKQIIWYGNPPFGASASNLEVTHVNGGLRGLPHMYGNIGADDYGVQDVRGCFYDPGGNYPEPPCIRFKANRWMEFTVRVEVKGPYAPESRVQLWVDGELAIDYQRARIGWGASDGDGLGQYQLTPFHTGKDSTHAHPTGHTWYDDLIISTTPIPMGSSSGQADTLSPAPPSNISAE